MLAMATGATLASSLPFAVQAAPMARPAPSARPLRILILGGTRFVGPAMVRAALLRGHEVTLFNRGLTRPWLFPGLELRKGNRYPELGEGLSSLRSGEWDAVIDVPAYFPRIVEESARLLRGRVGHYVMMSSISLYADFRTPGLTESYPRRALRGDFKERVDLSEDWDFATYGARKALCEDAVTANFGASATFLRACGIMGGGMSDPSKWVWPARLARLPVVAAAGDGTDPIQVVDRRDIADFAIRTIERRLTSAFNVTGARLPFREALETTRRVVGGGARIVWTGDAGREALGPLPGAAPIARAPGFAAIDGSKARTAGLGERPYAESVAEDWLYFREHFPLDFDFHAAGHAPDPADEERLLAALSQGSPAQ